MTGRGAQRMVQVSGRKLALRALQVAGIGVVVILGVVAFGPSGATTDYFPSGDARPLPASPR